VKEIHDVLPNRKVGFVDPEMRGYSSRETRYALYQRLASSEYDIILMPESAASEIQLTPEHDAAITGGVISKHLVEKTDASERNRENTKENAARKLENGKTNRTIYFEDFGCDAVFVDEAHRYKNLFTSSLSRETGLNDGRTSAKAMALFKKTEYIRQNNDGKNIFLLTATPLTNSPLEYYNMLMFIAPEELEKFGIYTIDGFIKNFAHIEQGYTYDWKTGDVASKRILTGFKNIQTLQNIFFKYTDYQNDPEKINLIKPAALNHPNVIPPNAKQTAVLKEISMELDAYIQCPKEDRDDLFPGQNFLTFYSRMRTASLDLELYKPGAYKNWEDPKLEKLAQNTKAIYDKTKAGQVVFCDRVFSGDGSFDIHEKIRRSLVKRDSRRMKSSSSTGLRNQGARKATPLWKRKFPRRLRRLTAAHTKSSSDQPLVSARGLIFRKIPPPSIILIFLSGRRILSSGTAAWTVRETGRIRWNSIPICPPEQLITIRWRWSSEKPTGLTSS
jgi:hypothetical protein